MPQGDLENFGAYRKAMELFDLAVEDMRELKRHPLCRGLAPHQIKTADSVCANIEEGYGRRTRKEYVRFLVIARASAREARGRYVRMRHWLPPEHVQARTGLCDEIIGILTRSISKLEQTKGTP